MKKIVRIGSLKEYGNVFCKIEIKEDGELSISGVMGPMRNGNSRGGCGQIGMEFEHRNLEHNDSRYSKRIKPEEFTFAPGWDTEKWLEFLEIWHNWHLNHMKPGCVHQREMGWGKKKLELVKFTWSTQFHEMRNSAADGKLNSDQYEKFKEVSAEVMMTTIGMNSPKWKSPLIEKLLSEGWIKEGKKETKLSNWVHESEHPDGVLTKPCPVCGYKYGSAWLKEELPKPVIDFLTTLPDTDVQPAWV